MATATLQRDAFMPRPPPGLGRGLVLALVVHVGLVVMLALGVSWHSSTPAAAEAELWAAVPQVAAPRAVEPEPTPQPIKRAVPVPPPPAEPAPQKVPDAQIAIEKAKRDEAKREAAEQLKDEQERKKKEKDLAREKAAEVAKVEDTKKAEAAVREANLKRMMGQLDATGSPDSRGTAQQSKGPSPGYGGRVKARVLPNITFDADSVPGNPVAEVEVRVAADGTIQSRRITKSSGVPAWDTAVLRAIDKTEVLPRDTDGRAPPSFALVFSPRDQ